MKLKGDTIMTITRYYTVFWDTYRGYSDDKSFYSREDAEKFFDVLNVPYKKILVTTDEGEYDLKIEKDEAYYAELEAEETYQDEIDAELDAEANELEFDGSLDDYPEDYDLEFGFDPYAGCYTYDC